MIELCCEYDSIKVPYRLFSHFQQNMSIFEP